MCSGVMVCHGDMVKVGQAKNAYTEEQIESKKKIGSRDSGPATFYISADGKYAIDADYVSLADLSDPDFDLTSVPKIKLSEE